MKIIVMLLIGFALLFATVDINSASIKELTSLIGIGAKKAQAIVNYRKRNCFKSVDALVNIKGIGKKTVEKNRAYITIGKCKK